MLNAGRYSEARTSFKRSVAEIEGALGIEAEELLEPLRLLADTFRRAGLLDDAYNVMMRAMTLSEKHHGEEGLVTCRLRTVMGELRHVSFPSLSPAVLLPAISSLVSAMLLCRASISTASASASGRRLPASSLAATPLSPAPSSRLPSSRRPGGGAILRCQAASEDSADAAPSGSASGMSLEEARAELKLGPAARCDHAMYLFPSRKNREIL